MIDIPPQIPPQTSLNAGVQGESLLPGSLPQPHSSGGNTVIPLPQPAGAPPPSAVGTVSQLNVTNATSDAVSAPTQSEIPGSNTSAGNSSNGTTQAGAINGQSQSAGFLPASDYTLPRTAADVFSSVPENEEGAESATMNADAAARLTAIFRPESSDEWKKALQKAGQQQQNNDSVGGVDGESAGQTLSMKEAQAQYGQDIETAISPTNGAATRGRSDTVQSPATASSTSTIGNDSDNDHKVWKPRRTLRA